jgi:hypothetical protein
MGATVYSRKRPGRQIGEVGGQRPQRVGTHALVDEMAECLDILLGEKLSQFVAAVNRQDGGDRVELCGTARNWLPVDVCHAIDDAGAATA